MSESSDIAVPMPFTTQIYEPSEVSLVAPQNDEPQQLKRIRSDPMMVDHSLESRPIVRTGSRTSLRSRNSDYSEKRNRSVRACHPHGRAQYL